MRFIIDKSRRKFNVINAYAFSCVCFLPLNRSLENYKRYFKYIYEHRDNSIRFIPRPRSIFYPYLLIQHYLNYRNINILHFSTCKHFNKLLNSLSGIFLHEAEQKWGTGSK